jgi:hypothetical protein
MDEEDFYYDDEDDYYDGLCYCAECCAYRSGYNAGYADAMYDLGEGYE